MSAIEIAEPGGPETLRLARRNTPKPGPGEVLIRVAAAGVNGPDMVQRAGLYPPPPGASDLLGLEVSGHVAAIGDGVSDTALAPGAPVCALTSGGGYAEYVAVDARHAAPPPEGVALLDAAGLPETYFTVWSNCFLDLRWPEGAVFLVHGGAGGIGSTAIQLGAALGLRVFATAATAEDAAFCESLGAERGVDASAEDFVSIVKAAGGADLILDILGGPVIAQNIKAARHDARLIQLAFNKGATVELNLTPIMLKRLTYTGSTLRSRDPSFKARVAASLRDTVWPRFAEGAIKPLTHAVFPFAAAAEAHRLMEAGGHRGKILLTPT
ncbi:MAG: NAD(P)H-quinone oxidoreductase [Pseudomonadota bacterium]